MAGDGGPVSLDATNVPQDDAIKRLADAAGWSVVVKDQGDEAQRLAWSRST